MNEIAEKLNKTRNTKAEIKAALIEKGQEVSDVFSTYPDKIRAIRTGYITATDDGAGNVTITMDGASATHSNGNVTIE